jgi:hypothetical protein
MIKLDKIQKKKTLAQKGILIWKRMIFGLWKYSKCSPFLSSQFSISRKPEEDPF